MLRVLLRSCVEFLRQTVVNRLKSTRVREAVAQVCATILDYQEAAVEVCLHWALFANLPKKLVG